MTGVRAEMTGRRGRIHGWRRRTTTLLIALVAGLLPAISGASASAQVAGTADMVLLGVADNPDPATGSGAIYTVEIANAGPSDATNVRVDTQLPPGVHFEPTQSDSTCAEAEGIVTCGRELWSANGVGHLLVYLSFTTVGPVELTFTVGATESDPNLSNNSQTETTLVIEPTEADVSLALPGLASGYAGQVIWFSLQVGNLGPATATGVTVALHFPTGIQPASPADTVGCTQTGEGLTCRYPMGSMRPGTGNVQILALMPSAAGYYEVRGQVSADQIDPFPSNNVATGRIEVQPAADIAVQIAESADPSLPGLPLTYAVTVSNQGPSPASGVGLLGSWNTSIAGGVELLSLETSQGVCALPLDGTSGGQIDCELGEMASGATVTVRVTLRPRGVGSVNLEAEASASLFDGDTTNNRDVESTAIHG